MHLEFFCSILWGGGRQRPRLTAGHGCVCVPGDTVVRCNRDFVIGASLWIPYPRCTMVLSAEVCIPVLFACGGNRTRLALRVLPSELLIAAGVTCAVVNAYVVGVNRRRSCHGGIYERTMFWAPWRRHRVVRAPSAERVIARRHFKEFYKVPGGRRTSPLTVEFFGCSDRDILHSVYIGAQRWRYGCQSNCEAKDGDARL